MIDIVFIVSVLGMLAVVGMFVPRSGLPPDTPLAIRREYRRRRADLRGARIHARIVVAPSRTSSAPVA